MKIQEGTTYFFNHKTFGPIQREVLKVVDGVVIYRKDGGMEYSATASSFVEEFENIGAGSEKANEVVVKSQFEMVKEFHQTFGHPVAEVPGALEKHFGIEHEARINAEAELLLGYMKVAAKAKRLGSRHFRTRLMLEELIEFMEADDLVGQVDAMLDLLYFVNGTLVEMGVDPEKPFAMVHAANMRKLWPDGKPRWNAEGKIMKPEGWVGPEDELRNYIESLEEA